MANDKVNILKSLIIPVYNNEENIPHLLSALEKMAQRQGTEFEVIFVVDGSPDASYEKLNFSLPTLTFSAQIICHSRNFGAFAAVRTGMKHAKGIFIAVMAADLQEPPELIEECFKILEKDDADVVFGQRTGRKDPLLRRLFSDIYWNLYRKIVLPDIPNGGVDIFACNGLVKETVLLIEEPNSSLIAQLFWVGYRRSFVPYERLERQLGSSAWSWRKRTRYMLDSIFSYSDFPIMTILWIGLSSFIASFFVGTITLIGKLLGWIDVPGYTALMIVILFIGSAILTTQGFIGCYLWRAFENSKKRPLSIISSTVKNNL